MEALAVKYRPKEFSSVCSQSSIVKILNRQLQLNEIKNCYLFAGASGCGKTTTARIFANEINKGVGTPIEIDAASNNGVDNIREIVKSAKERAIYGEYKIYIIDECHMLTTQSWNALLKIIEEPPQYTIFIFCTTDPQKIPATILNRVMRFNFTRIDNETIKRRLAYICQQEGFINYQDSIDFIAKLSKGGMRDAISTLEKAASYDTDLSINNVLDALGNYSYDDLFTLVFGLMDGKEDIVLDIVTKLYNKGNDLRLFIDQLLSFCLDLDKYSIFKTCAMTSLPISLENKLKEATNFQDASGYYNYVTKKLLELKNMIKNDSDVKSTVEVMLLTIARCQ